jgi:hypothetical protein
MSHQQQQQPARDSGGAFPDLHHKMSKKIAQLTKVIYHLNSKNEMHEAEVQGVQDLYESEIDEVRCSGVGGVGRRTQRCALVSFCLLHAMCHQHYTPYLPFFIFFNLVFFNLILLNIIIRIRFSCFFNPGADRARRARQAVRLFAASRRLERRANAAARAVAAAAERRTRSRRRAGGRRTTQERRAARGAVRKKEEYFFVLKSQPMADIFVCAKIFCGHMQW